MCEFHCEQRSTGMFFFEYKQELYYVLCLLVTPAVSCLALYFIKPKLIWLSPVITICLSCVISLVYYPYYFQDIAKNDYDFTTVNWLIFFVPVQIVSALIFTGITYAIFRKRKRVKGVCKFK